MKYVCDVCGWEYDEEQGYPEGGIAPGTKWADIPEEFECPLCSVGKDQFSAARLYFKAVQPDCCTAQTADKPIGRCRRAAAL